MLALMPDVVLDKPDGSEFDASAEVPEQLDLLDVIGVNDIDPDSVGDTWQLTPDGKLFVVKVNNIYDDLNYIVGPGRKNTTFGSLIDDSSNLAGIIYLVAGQAVDEMKQVADIEGGFRFGDEHQLTPDRKHIPFSNFFRSRTSGVWTMQAPTKGLGLEPRHIQHRQELEGLVHDRKLKTHLAAAMGATQLQVDFYEAAGEKIDELIETEADDHKRLMMEVMMAALVDSTVRSGIDGLLAGPFKVNNVPVSAALLAYIERHELDLEEGIEAHSVLFHALREIKDDMGFDPPTEQAKAHARAEKIRETFGL